MTDRATDPVRIPGDFWGRAQVQHALRARDVRALFHLVRKYAGVSQFRLGAAVGLSQGTVSQIMSGAREVRAFDVHERIADGLQMPAEYRQAFGLAAVEVRFPSLTHRTDGLPRRDMLRLGGAAATAGLVAGGHALASVVDALTPLGDDVAGWGSATVAQLSGATTNATRNYQACRYAAVLDGLPNLLKLVHVATSTASGDELHQAHRVAAAAYQVTSSVMLKLGDTSLATVAADRSMRCASVSGDQFAVASSARVLAHCLIRSGHAAHAKQMAINVAERQLDHTGPATADLLSLYGALLLRAAIAAARINDRASASTLLDEATQTAQRLGRDDNALFTAFGPTNVELHRVHIAVELGDAGTAVDLAARIDSRRLALPERKASLYLDTARAYAQWRKYDRAIDALLEAERVAPEEVATRSVVPPLVLDLARQAPHATQSRVLEFAHRVGLDI